MEQKPNTSKVRDLTIGFFGWWLICGLGYWVSELLGRGGVTVMDGVVTSQDASIGRIWDYVFPVVTAIAIGVLFYKRRNWFAYGILGAIIINMLLWVSLWGDLLLLKGISFFSSGSFYSPLSFPTPFVLFMGY